MEPPAKRKPARFLSSWTLPPGITASSKGPSFAYCKFCKDNFSVTHGGCNDMKRHVQGKGHEKRYKEVSFLCLMHMKCIVISILVLAISVSILVLLDLVTSYFMIICNKNVLFSGGKVVHKFGAKSSKKADLYANG